MDFKTMTVEELEARKIELVAQSEEPETDLDAIEAEMKSINAELEERKSVEARKAEIRAQVAEGAGEPIQHFETPKTEETNVLP